MLKILKWNHLLLYLKRRSWNCICFQKPEVEQKLINTVKCCLHKRKDVKKKVKKKIGESFLELIFLFFIVSRIILTSIRLCVCIICGLFFTYALLEAVIEKCFLKSCSFKLSKILEKYLWKYLLLLKLQAVGLKLYWN